MVSSRSQENAMERSMRRQRGRAGRLVLGVGLIVVGGLLLAANFGFDVPRGVWRYWPFLLIALGCARLIAPADGDERRGGYWLLVVGIYGWVNVWNLFGLDWGTSWPIFLIAAGLMMLFGGGRRRRALRDGEGDERVA